MEEIRTHRNKTDTTLRVFVKSLEKLMNGKRFFFITIMMKMTFQASWSKIQNRLNRATGSYVQCRAQARINGASYLSGRASEA